MIKLKTILTEGFAWERKEGKGLPTMAEVKAEYDANQLEEKAVSTSQQQAAGIALSVKRGDAPMSALQGASKAMYDMSEDELEKIAGTKHAGLPSHVEESESVKPDFLDLDDDGDEEESMKSAANSTKSMNEGFVSRIKKNLIGGDLRK